MNILKGIAWALVLFGTLVALLGAFLMYSDYSASSWSTTNGTVLTSDYVKSVQTNPHPTTSVYRQSTGSARNRRIQTEYEPHVTYSYAFNGRNFTGSCCSESGSNNFQKVKDFLALAPIGASVLVRVNPDDPAQSRLDADVKSPLDVVKTILLAFGLSLAGLGFFLRSKSADPRYQNPDRNGPK